MSSPYYAPSPPFARLPIELVCNIIQLLDMEDAFVLGMSCRFFRDIIRDNSICRALVEKQAPFSDECVRMRPTWDYANALSAVAKRHSAIANLQPFAAAVVAKADVLTHGVRGGNGPTPGNHGYTRSYAPPPPPYVYAGKTLLYMVDRVLRILHLRGGATVRRETAVDVRKLLDLAVPASRGTRNYLFRPLHYSDGIVSCVYAHHRLPRGTAGTGAAAGAGVGGQQESWLVLFNSETRWCTSHRLALPHHRLFVRNNKEFLIFGTYTSRRLPEQDTDGAGLGGGEGANDDNNVTGGAAAGGAGPLPPSRHRRWVLRHYSILDDIWSTKAIFLDDAIGLADLGSSLCFEVIDGYFYALANQQRYLDDDGYDDDDYEADEQEVDEIDGGGGNTDADGERHYNGAQRSRAAGLFALASYYTCVRFPLSDPCRRETPTRASLWRRRNDEGAVDDRWTTLRLEKSEATGKIVAVESRKEWLRVCGASSSRRTYYMQPLEWASSDADRDSESSSRRLPMTASPQRQPENVHPGDDAARMMPLTLSKCGARVYSTASQTFLDLYYQSAPASAGPLAIPRLVLRAGTRQDRPPTQAGVPLGKNIENEDDNEGDSPLYPLREISKRYVDRDVVTWPANNNDSDDESARELNKVLNPPDFCGNVTSASWDDRLLIYSTASSEGSTYHTKQAIVIISFDPTLCLEGLKVWGRDRESEKEGEIEGPGCSAGASHMPALPRGGALGNKGGEGGEGGEGEHSHVSDYSSQATTVWLHEDGQKEGKEDARIQDNVNMSPSTSVNGGTKSSWASYGKPEYLRIGSGFDFTYHKRSYKRKNSKSL